ncbi:MAG TPA: glutaminyl-peptide cyclotransferase [Opitutaceae bacterium]
MSGTQIALDSLAVLCLLATMNLFRVHRFLAKCGLMLIGSMAIAAEPTPVPLATPASVPLPTATPSPAASSPAATAVHETYEIVHVYPHDTTAFTEGLLVAHGHFFESTGLNGESTLREVDITTGRVLRRVSLKSEYFGEGLAVLGDRAYQLTWKNNVGFVYSLDTFQVVDQFFFVGEGWGLTSDGETLIMSDGTSHLRVLDSKTLQTARTIDVTYEGQPLTNINELEYIHGQIFANIWQTNAVVRIDPATGKVIGIIDFSGLLKPTDYGPNTDVLNGIAYDAERDRLFITGKKWPKIFEVRLNPPAY